MNRPRLLQRVLRDCYCRLQPSKVDGIGVFAIRNIPSGVDPFKTIAKYAQPGYVRITEDELDGLPSGVSRLLRALFVPSEGKMYVPTCGTNVIYLNAYLNHSSRPNMRTQDGYTVSGAPPPFRIRRAQGGRSGAQCHGINSSMRFCGQPFTRRVSRSVK